MCRRPKAKLWIAKLDRLSRNAMHLAFVLLDSKKSGDACQFENHREIWIRIGRT